MMFYVGRYVFVVRKRRRQRPIIGMRKVIILIQLFFTLIHFITIRRY
jgi:hypothetical protein